MTRTPDPFMSDGTRSPAPAPLPRDSRRQERFRMGRRRWLWAIAIATGLTTIFSLHAWWEIAGNSGAPPLSTLIIVRAVDWYAWLPLLPLVLFVTKRAAARHNALALIGTHALGGIPIIIIQITISTIIGSTLPGMRPDGPFWPFLVSLYPVLLPWKLHIYALIAASLHAVLYLHQLDLQYSRLAGAEHEKRRSIEVLAGTAAHDFNNLLADIGSSIHRLDEADPERHRRIADDIQRDVDRASTVARHLLAMSRGLLVRPVRVDLCRLLRDAEPRLRDALDPGTDLRIQTLDHPLVTTADPDLLRFTLVNLVAAAAGGSQPGNTVLVQLAQPSPDHLSIRVEGPGPGLDQATLARIFEPGVSSKRVGHGLGLTAARSIIERSGGSIAASTGQGAGTVLNVTLPLMDPDHPGSASSAG